MKRSAFIKSLIGLYGVVKMPTAIIKQYHKIYLLECFVSGFQYYDGPQIIDDINSTGLFEMVREPHNKYDNNAISLHFNTRKIGFVPAHKNSILSVLLDNNLLELQVEVTHINKEAATWENVHIAIFVLKENTNVILPPKIQYKALKTPRYYSVKNDDSYFRILLDEAVKKKN